ncbi:MAG: GerW family sporulation protein [Clostridia bacterium]|nr:GerW family sporulation protein [Clostridia bacterium]
MANNVEGLMGVSVEKIREMVDANTVVGTPINLPDGTTLIPVSKISYGFASGGSDLPSKTTNGLFGGGAGAGITITPVAFLSIKDGQVNMLPVVAKPDTADRVVSMVPDMVDKISEKFSKKKKGQAADTVKDEY